MLPTIPGNENRTKQGKHNSKFTTKRLQVLVML